MSPEPPIQEKNTAIIGEKASSGRKVGGICPPNPSIQEKNTAIMSKKASFGRKNGGSSPDSRENYGQIRRKSKNWP